MCLHAYKLEFSERSHMSKPAPFSLVNQDLDKNPMFDCHFPNTAESLSPVCKPLYWQMVHTGCDQEVIDKFFNAISSSSGDVFGKINDLISGDGKYVQLAAYLLSTYRLLEPGKLNSPKDYANWFYAALKTIMDVSASAQTMSNPIWDAVINNAPYMNRVVSILGLFIKDFSPKSVNAIIMSQVPSSRLYSMSGLSEQMQEKAKEKIFGLRIDYLLKLADLCKRVFVSGDHVPDPETVSLIAGDFKDKYSDEPTIPDWAPKTTVAPKIDGSPSQSAGPIPKNGNSSQWRRIRTAKPDEGATEQEEPVTADNVPQEPEPQVSDTEPNDADISSGTDGDGIEHTVEPSLDDVKSGTGDEPEPTGTGAAVQQQETPHVQEPGTDISGTPEKTKPDHEPAIAQASPETNREHSAQGVSDVVASEPEESEDANLSAELNEIAGEEEDTETGTGGGAAEPDPDIKENASTDPDIPAGNGASQSRRIAVPQKVLMEIFNHAGSRDQIADAVRLVEQDIENNTPNAQFLVRFVPGVTQEVIKDILSNRTASGKYITRSTGKSGDVIPHTGLTGGTTYTAGPRTRELGQVEVPLGFAQENSSVLWDEPVITTMGYPFINFGAPEIYTILKDKDETKVKKAYKKLKKQLKKVGLSEPIKVLKDFRNSKGVMCALNRITVDAPEVLETGNANVTATVYPRATSVMNTSIGTVPLTRDFIVEMYKVLSPTKGAKIYMDALGMTEDEYADILNRDGHPPVYIFIPKEKLGFKKAPAGFIARLLTSNNKPTLVEAKIGTHYGGFVMPFKTTQILFTEV